MNKTFFFRLLLVAIFHGDFGDFNFEKNIFYHVKILILFLKTPIIYTENYCLCSMYKKIEIMFAFETLKSISTIYYPLGCNSNLILVCQKISK